MAGSRKREKELENLRRSAEELWDSQRLVLGRAADVARDARRQLAAGAGRVAREAGARLERDVIPGVGRAVGSALALGDAAREQRILRALARVSPALATKKKRGPGGAIAVTVVVALIAAVGYAVWQTFRAEDELWIADETDYELGE